MIRQADSYLPTVVMNVVGAAKTYAQRMQFYLGLPNTLMIGVLFYNDSPAVQSVFPTVYHWVAFIFFVFAPAMVAIDRFLLHPAEITYNAHQGSREERNPGFKEVMKVSRQLDRLEEQGITFDGGREPESEHESR